MRITLAVPCDLPPSDPDRTVRSLSVRATHALAWSASQSLHMDNGGAYGRS